MRISNRPQVNTEQSSAAQPNKARAKGSAPRRPMFGGAVGGLFGRKKNKAQAPLTQAGAQARPQKAPGSSHLTAPTARPKPERLQTQQLAGSEPGEIQLSPPKLEVMSAGEVGVYQDLRGDLRKAQNNGVGKKAKHDKMISVLDVKLKGAQESERPALFKAMERFKEMNPGTITTEDIDKLKADYPPREKIGAAVDARIQATLADDALFGENTVADSLDQMLENKDPTEQHELLEAIKTTPLTFPDKDGIIASLASKYGQNDNQSSLQEAQTQLNSIQRQNSIMNAAIGQAALTQAPQTSSQIDAAIQDL